MDKVAKKQKLWIALVAFVVLFVPMLGALLLYGGHLPPGFFNFPPIAATPKPGFNQYIFIGLLIACLFFIVLYIQPWWFGFKKTAEHGIEKKGNLPFWFYPAIVVSVVDAIVLWGHLGKPRILIEMGFIPVIWGFVIALDAIVYKRTQGNSLLGKSPKTMLWVALCSAIGWGYFEYLSLFVGVNWYYPQAKLLGTLGFYVYAFVGGAALIPFVFEIYSFLNTLKIFKKRYSLGPKISIKRKYQWVFLVLSIITLYLISYFPYILYPFIWLSPVLILSLVFDMVGIWTPFRPIAEKGDWNPLALIGLSDLLQGLTCEMTNYLSAQHHPFNNIVPGYWKYSIPYVDTWHVFEMPFEGLFGYLPYGIYNWVVWIGLATLLGVAEKKRKLNWF
jgi:hypothetical protein